MKKLIMKTLISLGLFCFFVHDLNCKDGHEYNVQIKEFKSLGIHLPNKEGATPQSILNLIPVAEKAIQVAYESGKIKSLNPSISSDPGALEKFIIFAIRGEEFKDQFTHLTGDANELYMDTLALKVKQSRAIELLEENKNNYSYINDAMKIAGENPIVTSTILMGLVIAGVYAYKYYNPHVIKHDEDDNEIETVEDDIKS
jgi:hypothetical protein